LTDYTAGGRAINFFCQILTPGVKIDAPFSRQSIIENKMPRPQTVSVRLTIECDFTRQEVYNAVKSRFDDDRLSEKQMDAIWAWLSKRSLGYTDVSNAVFNEDETGLCDLIKDGLADVINDEGLLEKDEEDVEANKKEVDETNGWEEVYNSSDKRNGTSRTYCDQPGTFYQTYGNGGGPGGWGGYWVRQGGRAVWEVAGSKFTYLEGCQLEVRPQDSFRGVCAAVRPVPLTLSQEQIQQELRAFAQEKPSGFEAAAAQAAQYLWDKTKGSAVGAAV
jgi:hypothetical protein